MKKIFLLSIMISITVLMIGCGKENEPVVPSENWVSLSDILDDESFGSLSLISTKWKLIGFADEEQGSFKYAEPSNEKSFILDFQEIGILIGTSSTNEMTGEYTVKNNQINIENWGGTKIGEINDGDLYRESIPKVYYYRINLKGLLLYYSDKNAMLFQPIN